MKLVHSRCHNSKRLISGTFRTSPSRLVAHEIKLRMDWCSWKSLTQQRCWAIIGSLVVPHCFWAVCEVPPCCTVFKRCDLLIVAAACHLDAVNGLKAVALVYVSVHTLTTSPFQAVTSQSQYPRPRPLTPPRPVYYPLPGPIRPNLGTWVITPLPQSFLPRPQAHTPSPGSISPNLGLFPPTSVCWPPPRSILPRTSPPPIHRVCYPLLAITPPPPHTHTHTPPPRGHDTMARHHRVPATGTSCLNSDDIVGNEAKNARFSTQCEKAFSQLN